MGLTFNHYHEKCNKSITPFLGYLGTHTDAGAEIKKYANTSLCILMWDLLINADAALQRVVHAGFGCHSCLQLNNCALNN